MRWGAVIGAVLVAAVSGGCAAGDVETVRVARVGSQTVTIPDETPKTVFGVTRALLAQSAFEPWYQRCIMGAFESQVTPAEATELTELPDPEENVRALELMGKFGQTCEGSKRRFVKPDATHEELALIREQTAASMGDLFQTQGLGRKAQACVEQGVRILDDDSLTFLLNAPEEEKLRQLEGIFDPCY